MSDNGLNKDVRTTSPMTISLLGHLLNTYAFYIKGDRSEGREVYIGSAYTVPPEEAQWFDCVDIVAFEAKGYLTFVEEDVRKDPSKLNKEKFYRVVLSHNGVEAAVKHTNNCHTHTGETIISNNTNNLITGDSYDNVLRDKQILLHNILKKVEVSTAASDTLWAAGYITAPTNDDIVLTLKGWKALYGSFYPKTEEDTKQESENMFSTTDNETELLRQIKLSNDANIPVLISKTASAPAEKLISHYFPCCFVISEKESMVAFKSLFDKDFLKVDDSELDDYFQVHISDSIEDNGLDFHETYILGSIKNWNNVGKPVLIHNTLKPDDKCPENYFEDAIMIRDSSIIEVFKSLFNKRLLTVDAVPLKYGYVQVRAIVDTVNKQESEQAKSSDKEVYAKLRNIATKTAAHIATSSIWATSIDTISTHLRTVLNEFADASACSIDYTLEANICKDNECVVEFSANNHIILLAVYSFSRKAVALEFTSNVITNTSMYIEDVSTITLATLVELLEKYPQKAAEVLKALEA